MSDRASRSNKRQVKDSLDDKGKPERDGSASTDKLAIRTTPKRVRRDHSAASSKRSLQKKARLKAGGSLNGSAARSAADEGAGVKQTPHLVVPGQDDSAITSDDDDADSPAGASTNGGRSLIAIAADGELLTSRPDWAVRHRIYLDNKLLSTTTSTQRPGLHKFQDLLLREQLETRLLTPHNGEEAHFATRHAILRFWRNDGSLAEKWMDKDHGGEKEHEFALENLNDWTILQLSVGVEKEAEDDEDDDSSDEEMEDEHDSQDLENQENQENHSSDHVIATIDIIAHYISDYHDARNIASAPGMQSDSEEAAEGEAEPNEDEEPRPAEPTTDDLASPARRLHRESSLPIYHWVEERRRALEHQLRAYFHCAAPSCFNRGGTCLALSPAQHLHVGVKDLTDWSQQIAHAHRSMAATTLHLVAKLVDDQVRAQDERLADVGREREDEDDLGEVLRGSECLGGLRPGGRKGEAVELEMLE